MNDYMKEAERLAHAYAEAYADFIMHGKSGDDEALAALLAHIQRGAVPEGYDIAPTFRGYAKLGIGQYVLHNCPRTDEDHPSLVIAIATEEEKAGRQVGELRQSQPGLMIQPERIAVRIDFKSVAALDALEQQLRFLREDSFPESLTATAPDQFRDAAKMMAVQPTCMTCSGHGMVGGLLPNGGGYQADPCPDCAAPVTAGVPMPKPVAYGFGNTAITGHTNRLMMVRIDIPGDDQYAGAFWLPLVLADEAHTYGVACRAAGEAAGYAQGLRDAVREGWKEATIAWEVCASIHREYAKKKDPFFTTRQADFVKHTEAARSAMLAAAPAPDHFRDAAKMVAEPADDRIASAIHYPECWDTAAYPTVESALSEVFAHYRCTEHDAPGEVPMPEPTVSTYEGYRDSAGVWHPMAYSNDQMRTYGIACRAAGEAAGYARGLREMLDCRTCRNYTRDGCIQTAQCVNSDGYRRAMPVRFWSAALRGEVKP